jgi:hypothetical protein
MMKRFALLLLLGASAVRADDPPKGTICFEKNCTAVTGVTFAVKAADVDRRFVWTSVDATKVVLGVLAANAPTVDLETKDATNIALSVRGDAQRGWPVETRFAISESPDRQWRWSIPAKLIGKSLSIRVRPGTYMMLIGADHHKGVRRPLRVETKDLDLHQITLSPVPAVAGRVVTTKKGADDKEPKEAGVSGAQVARSDGKIIATTNEQGGFRAEILEPVTKELVFTTPGLATRVLPLHIVAADTDLGVITLASGVKLTVHIERPDTLKSKTLHATLTEASKTEYENTNIATREVKPGEDEVIFPDLSEGEYYVMLSGDAPLEKLTTAIEVKNRDVTEQIRIRPFELRGTVRLGSDPLREGAVGVHDNHHSWESDLLLDQEGRFGGVMWQAGGIGGWVNSKETGSLPIDGEPVLTGDPASWDITFRRRFIAGRIFDEETKLPVARVGLHLELEAGEQTGAGMGMRRLYTNVHVDDDGHYSIAATRDGIYDLAVNAPDHVDVRRTIELKDVDESKTADFPLTNGIEQPIDFAWPSGEPVANGSVLSGVARDGHNAAWYGSTDVNGRLSLRMRAGESRTLFIVPAQGSFAAVHVVAGDGKPIRVIVSQPAASLVVNMHDADSKPVAAGTAIRWNGEWLPAPVVMRLSLSRLGPGSVRFSLMPAGSYELWAVRGGALTLGPPPVEPVRAGLSAGEQVVDILVEK